MVAKRLRAWEASRYRRRQPLKAVGTRGEFWRKTPFSTFDKIFDKPQPPRVQRPQILARMITVSRLRPGFLRGLPAKNAIAHSACRLDIGVQRVKRPRAVMPDKMQQRSVPVFGSSATGNCGKPRARTSSAPSMERARSDIAQHLRRVGCLRNEHHRRLQMESQDVASATNVPGSRDACLRLFAKGTPVRPAPSGAGMPN